MLGIISATLATGLSYLAERGLNHGLAKLTGGYVLVQIQLSNVIAIFAKEWLKTVRDVAK